MRPCFSLLEPLARKPSCIIFCCWKRMSQVRPAQTLAKEVTMKCWLNFNLGPPAGFLWDR